MTGVQAKTLEEIPMKAQGGNNSGPKNLPAVPPLRASIDHHTLSIEFLNEAVRDITLQITDINGNLVYEEFLPSVPAQGHLIYLNGYEAGIYRLHYLSGNVRAFGNFEIE